MGIPAAHPLGFSRGGLLRLQDEYMALRRGTLEGVSSTFHNSKQSIQSMEIDNMQKMESLGIEIDKRKDIVLAQCTSALVASFIATANKYAPPSTTSAATSAAFNTTRTMSHEWWGSTARAGFMLHFETLLNNSKKDQCLLEDFVVGARALEKIYITIVNYSAHVGETAPTVEITHVHAAQGSSGSNRMQLNLYLGANYPFSNLPEAIQRGAMIPVRTTLFSHSPSRTPSSNSLSNRINVEGLQKLRKYCAIRTRRPPQQHRGLHGSYGSPQWNATLMQEIAELLQAAQTHLNAGQETSQWNLRLNRVARLVGAGRVTTCKDGMDLTSMAITLEFSNLLRDNHRIQNVEDSAHTLRLRGVRRDNVQKNTYQRQYATLVGENLSPLYKPPRGTTL